MSYYSPLFQFSSDINKFQIKTYLEICQDAFTLRKIDKEEFLGTYEIDEILGCKYWLKINDSFPKYLSPRPICNTILLSFWVLKPNQIETRYRFGDDNSFFRQLDRFQFNRVDDNINFFNLGDLQNISTYYNSFCRINRHNKRLYIAKLNTFRGCLSYHWVVAFILYSSALEAILNYKRGYGLTKRLAKAYACLLANQKRERDALYKNFAMLYGIRSDIMHGKHRKWAKAQGNLKKLSELAILLRQLWQKILSDKDLESTLDKDNSARETFFKRLQKGYATPPS